MNSASFTAAITALSDNRQAFIRAWAAAVYSTCGEVAATEELYASLNSLLDKIVDALLESSSLLEAGYSIGQDLAALTCRSPEVVGQTTLILGEHLQGEPLTEERRLLQQALASLSGGMAQGFLSEAAMVVPNVGSQVATAPRADQRYYSIILDMIDVLIVVIDTDGYITGFNGAAERTSGYSFDEVYGRHYTFLQAPESHAKTATLIECLKKLPPEQHTFVSHQSTWVTRQGLRREIEWSQTALYRADGAMNFIIGTGADVTGSRQIERELTEAQRQVALVKEAERLRLAQDLHDGAVQQLLGISYQLSEMQRRATEPDIWSPTQRLEELAPGLEVIRGEIVTVAQGLRRLISSLRPPALREMGLAEILDIYISDWRAGVGREGPEVKLKTDSLEGRHLPEPVATCIFRVIQEGIWNAHKHAMAKRVDIILQCADDQVVLRIKDDGQGFRIPKYLFQFATAGRFGFIGMQERVHAVDGLLSVWSEPGRGTEIQAHIPIWNSG